MWLVSSYIYLPKKIVLILISWNIWAFSCKFHILISGNIWVLSCKFLILVFSLSICRIRYQVQDLCDPNISNNTRALLKSQNLLKKRHLQYYLTKYSASIYNIWHLAFQKQHFTASHKKQFVPEAPVWTNSTIKWWWHHKTWGNTFNASFKNLNICTTLQMTSWTFCLSVYVYIWYAPVCVSVLRWRWSVLIRRMMWRSWRSPIKVRIDCHLHM